MTGLCTEGLTVTLGRAEVVRDVCLQVPEGGWLSLVGPNGAGKSTLLRAVAGLVRYRGTITLDGVDLAGAGRRRRARSLALVEQEPLRPPGFTVRQYVLLGRTPHIPYFGRETRGDRRVMERTLLSLDLGPLADRPVHTLSGGEWQRAVVARAAAQEARVLLLDEPTSSLDLGRQQQVLELVSAMREAHGTTVVAAMHDLTLAGAYGSTVALMGAGALLAHGPADEVLTEDAVRDAYGASVRVFTHDGATVVVPVRDATAA